MAGVRVLRVNLLAPMLLTRALLRYMRPAPLRSRLVFISSDVSTLPTPEYAAYTASKAGELAFLLFAALPHPARWKQLCACFVRFRFCVFLERFGLLGIEEFARSVRIELAADGIDVGVVRPCPTRTALHRKLGIDLARMNTARFATPRDTAAAVVAIATAAILPRLVVLGGRLRGQTLCALGALLPVRAWVSIWRCIRWWKGVQGVARARSAPHVRTTCNVSTSPRVGTALVVGGASGIGEGFCCQFLTRRYKVCATRISTPADFLQSRPEEVAWQYLDLSAVGGEEVTRAARSLNAMVKLR